MARALGSIMPAIMMAKGGTYASPSENAGVIAMLMPAMSSEAMGESRTRAHAAAARTRSRADVRTLAGSRPASAVASGSDSRGESASIAGTVSATAPQVQRSQVMYGGPDHGPAHRHQHRRPRGLLLGRSGGADAHAPGPRGPGRARPERRERVPQHYVAEPRDDRHGRPLAPPRRGGEQHPEPRDRGRRGSHRGPDLRCGRPVSRADPLGCRARGRPDRRGPRLARPPPPGGAPRP